MRSTPSSCNLNSPPPPAPPSKGPVTIHHLRRGVGVGGFGGFHVVFKGEGRGGISCRWQSVKGVTAEIWLPVKGGGCQNITEPRGGGETGKFKLNFSDRLSS